MLLGAIIPRSFGAQAVECSGHIHQLALGTARQAGGASRAHLLPGSAAVSSCGEGDALGAVLQQ